MKILVKGRDGRVRPVEFARMPSPEELERAAASLSVAPASAPGRDPNAATIARLHRVKERTERQIHALDSMARYGVKPPDVWLDPGKTDADYRRTLMATDQTLRKLQGLPTGPKSAPAKRPSTSPTDVSADAVLGRLLNPDLSRFNRPDSPHPDPSFDPIRPLLPKKPAARPKASGKTHDALRVSPSAHDPKFLDRIYALTDHAEIDKLDFELSDFVRAVQNGSATVRTHLANPEDAGNALDLAEVAAPAFSGFLHPNRDAFKSIGIDEAARSVARSFGIPEKYARNLRDLRSAGFKKVLAAVGAGARSVTPDDPYAAAREAGASRQAASIVAQDPDIGNAGNAELYGKSVGAVLAPFSQTRHILMGDSRSVEQRPIWERAIDTVGDNASAMVAGGVGSALSKGLVRGGVEVGLEAAANAAARKTLPELANQASKRVLTSIGENAALQGPVVYGRAAELGRQNGKGALGNLGAATSEAARGLTSMVDVRKLFDPHASPEERVNAAFFWGAAMLGAGVKGYEHVGRMIESGRIPKGVHPAVAQAAQEFVAGPEGAAKAHDLIERFRAADGKLYAVPIRGDRAGIHDIVHPDGSVTPQHGGSAFGLKPENKGYVWTSLGEEVDKAIQGGIEKTKGLGIVFIGSKEQARSSGAPRVYADAIRSSLKRNKTDAGKVEARLRAVLSNVKGADVARIQAMGAEELLQTLHDKSWKANGKVPAFPEVATVTRKLGQKGNARALGIPLESEMLRQINNPKHHDLPTNSAITLFQMEPGLGAPVPKGQPGWHPDYGFAIKGEHLGDLPHPVSLHEIAAPDYAQWHGEETLKHTNYQRLEAKVKSDLDQLVANLTGERKKKAVEKFAVERGVQGGLRLNAPSPTHYHRSLEFSKRPIELDELALRRALGYDAESYNGRTKGREGQIADAVLAGRRDSGDEFGPDFPAMAGGKPSRFGWHTRGDGRDSSRRRLTEAGPKDGGADNRSGMVKDVSQPSVAESILSGMVRGAMLSAQPQDDRKLRLRRAALERRLRSLQAKGGALASNEAYRAMRADLAWVERRLSQKADRL